MVYNYMVSPRVKIDVNSVEMLKEFLNFQVILRENGFDTATLIMSNDQSKNWIGKVSSGHSIEVSVKDYSDAAWTKIFSGIIKVASPGLSIETGKILKLKCSGAGYGFAETVCGEQYGTESTNSSLDTIKEILTDATHGVVPKWVNKILGSGTNSGYNYDTGNVETITGSLNYVYFPFKPCNKALGDLCDLVTAVKAGSAGPHWIVTTDNKLRVKLIGATQTGWTKYYLGSQANATFEERKDLVTVALQELESEANYILYQGALRKPASEQWTEGNAASWDVSGNYSSTPPAASDEATIKKVGSYSLQLDTGDGAGPGSIEACYPSSKDAAWDITKWGGEFSIPILTFFIRRASNVGSAGINLHTDATNYVQYQFSLGTADRWYKVDLPVGPYYKQHTTDDNIIAIPWNSPNWSNMNYINIFAENNDSNVATIYVDDLFFAGQVLRGAKNSTAISADKLKLRVITDDVGKDDSGKAADDSGTIAQLAYMELLRRQTTPLVGTIQLPMLKDLLPGQFLHLHAEKQASGSFRVDKDVRVTKVAQSMSEKGVLSNVYWTDDLTNSHPRRRFDDLNKVYAAVRPEFQDRQATSIKVREIDITQAILEKDYP